MTSRTEYRSVFRRADFDKALAASANLRPELARDLLGWRPRRAPFGESAKVYYHAWLASQA